MPSETKLVETPRSDEAYILRLLGRIAELEQSYVKAREFIEQQDAALASLADELRLAREEQIALLRFVEHPVTPEMWKAMFPKEPR